MWGQICACCSHEQNATEHVQCTGLGWWESWDTDWQQTTVSANKRQAKNVSTNDRLRVGATSWTTESDVFKKVWQDSLHILCISMYIDIKLENSNEYLNTFSGRWIIKPCYHNCTTFTKPIRLLMSSKIQNLARHFLSTNEKSLNKQEIEKYIQKKWRSNRLQSILCLHI